MTKKHSQPLSMTELCEYFEERNARLFKGEASQNKDEKAMKSKPIEERIRQRNSRPSLRLQLCSETNGTGISHLHGSGRPVPTPPPFSPRQTRFGRSLRSPVTSHSACSSSGCSCCSSPLYDPPLTPYSTGNSSGYSGCSWLSNEPSPRPGESSLHSPATPYSTCSSSGCFGCFWLSNEPSPRPVRSPLHSPSTPHSTCSSSGCCGSSPSLKEIPGCGSRIQPSQFSPLLIENKCYEPESYCNRYSLPSSPYSPRVPQVSRASLSHPSLSSTSSNRAFADPGCLAISDLSAVANEYTCGLCLSLYSQQFTSRRSSFPSLPRASSGQHQSRMIRSMPCSPNTKSAYQSQGLCAPHQPLLSKRRQKKNERHLRKNSDGVEASIESNS